MKTIGVNREETELRVVLAGEPKEAAEYVARLLSEEIGHPFTYRPNEGIAVHDRQANQTTHLLPGINMAFNDEPGTARTLWRMDRESWGKLTGRPVARPVAIRQDFIGESYIPRWDGHQILEPEGTVGGLYYAGREYSVECQGPMPCENPTDGAATIVIVRPEGIGSAFALDRVAKKIVQKNGLNTA